MRGWALGDTVKREDLSDANGHTAHPSSSGWEREQFDAESPGFRGPGTQSDDLREGAVVRRIITERGWGVMRNRCDLIRVSYAFSMRPIAFVFIQMCGIFPEVGALGVAGFRGEDGAHTPRSCSERGREKEPETG